MKHNKESKFKEKIKNSHQTISSPQRLDDSSENPLREITVAPLQRNCLNL